MHIKEDIMASNRNKRAVRNTKTGSNAMQIQRKINMDYADLWADYKKLGLELWQLPVTKFIVGGAALGALTPLLMKVYKEYDLDTIKSKIDDFVDQVKDSDVINE
jgi:hypothetical protein